MIAIPVYVREEKNYDLLKACLDSIESGNSEDSIELIINAFDVAEKTGT